MHTGLSPTLVGALRGLVYAVLIAALAAVVAFAGGLAADDLGQYAWALPFLGLAARSLEGFVDKLRGQAPQLPGGSKPADPSAYADSIPVHAAAPWAISGNTVSGNTSAQEPAGVWFEVSNPTPTGVRPQVDADKVAEAVAAALPGKGERTVQTRERVTAAVMGVIH